MYNAKLRAARRVLTAHKITVPDEIILKMLEATERERDAAYEKGDFVEYYEGMGETGHGTVVRKLRGGYRILIFDYEGRVVPFETMVTDGDMRGLTTPAKAMAYFRMRSNID